MPVPENQVPVRAPVTHLGPGTNVRRGGRGGDLDGGDPRFLLLHPFLRGMGDGIISISRNGTLSDDNIPLNHFLAHSIQRRLQVPVAHELQHHARHT